MLAFDGCFGVSLYLVLLVSAKWYGQEGLIFCIRQSIDCKGHLSFMGGSLNNVLLNLSNWYYDYLSVNRDYHHWHDWVCLVVSQ